MTVGEGIVEEARGTRSLSERRKKTKAGKKRNAREKRANAVVAVIPHPVPQTALNVDVHLMKECLATSQSKTKTLTKTSL